MWINISDIPAEGQTFIFEEQSIWTDPMKEFGIQGRVLVPLRGEVFLLPQAGESVQGCLVRGTLTGAVALPCNRCAEDARIDINSAFENFEPFPAENDSFSPEESDNLVEACDEEVVRLKDGVLQFNPVALLWEEFALALPVKPLCRPDCKGLCPICGQNRNMSECSCNAETGDPRLAVLRNLTLAKKQ